MANLVVRLSVVVHMAADSDEIDPDFVRIDSQVTNRRNRTASCAGGSRHARWVEGRRAACSLPGIRILVLAYGPEQHTFAEIHEAHEHAGDGDDHQRG